MATRTLLAGKYPVYFTTSNSEQGLHKWDGATLTTLTTADGLPSNWTSAIAFSSSLIYIGTDSGLCIWDGGTSFTTKTTANGLISDNIFCLMVDQSGNVWIGTDGGLSIWDGVSFTNYTTADGLAGNGFWEIAEDSDGNVYMSNPGSGFTVWDGASFTAYTIADGLCSNDTRGCFVADDGNVWIGSEGSGYSVWDGVSFTNHTSGVDGFVSDYVRTIFQDKLGTMYLACYQGISIWNGSSWDNYTGLTSGNSPSFAACLDADNTVFFGCDNNATSWDGASFTDITGTGKTFTQCAATRLDFTYPPSGAKEILAMNTIGDVHTIYIDSDPTDIANEYKVPATGLEFPIGSMAFANIAGVGRVYQKTADEVIGVSTGWTILAAGTVPPAWELAGNALAGGEKFGSTNDVDVDMYRNNVLLAKLLSTGVAVGNFGGDINSALVAHIKSVQVADTENLWATDADKGDGTNRPYVIDRAKVKQIISSGSPVTGELIKFTVPANTVCLIEIDVVGRVISGADQGKAFVYRRDYVVRNINDVSASLRQSACPLTYKDVHEADYKVAGEVYNLGSPPWYFHALITQKTTGAVNYFTTMRVKVYNA